MRKKEREKLREHASSLGFVLNSAGFSDEYIKDYDEPHGSGTMVLTFDVYDKTPPSVVLRIFKPRWGTIYSRRFEYSEFLYIKKIFPQTMITLEYHEDSRFGLIIKEEGEE